MNSHILPSTLLGPRKFIAMMSAAGGGLWALSDLTDAERLAGFERLAGPQADQIRREGIAILQAAIAGLEHEDHETGRLRTFMADPPQSWLENVDLHPRADAWRRLHIRRLFRLSLEAMFYWILQELVDLPVGTDELAQRFLGHAMLSPDQSAREWLDAAVEGNAVRQLDQLADTLHSLEWKSVPALIANGLQVCLVSGRNEQWDQTEAFDRLPLARALRETEQWQDLTVRQFIGKIMDVWVIAQHAYWCVGRGLVDARGRGKTLLRLRIVTDEGGWTLTPALLLRAQAGKILSAGGFGPANPHRRTWV